MSDKITWELDKGWGLYDEDRNLIDGAAYYRGPGKNLIGQKIKAEDIKSHIEIAPPDRYLYGGNIIPHYGHFLISSLSRYWLGLFKDLKSFKIVCHAADAPTGWLSHPHIRDIFQAIGLSEDNFVVFKRPTVIPEIIIPRPAAEEHNFSHNVFGEWGAAVGRAITRDFDLPQIDRPVWLSKTRINAGVQGLDNEAALVEILEQNGVEIIHPQELPLFQQVSLFKTRPIIMGASSSAFHTKIFGATAKIVCLNAWQSVNSNFALVDLVSGDPISFLRPALLNTDASSSRYLLSASIVDPRAVADDLLEIVRKLAI
jgi:hypothetical protein